MAVELRNRVNRVFAGALTLSNTAVFDHPDATRLAQHLARELEGAEPDASRTRALPAVGRDRAEPVAIVGMACRFPGGPDLAAFRELLASGGDAVTRGRPDGLFVDAETEADRPFGAYVEGLDRFDAGFFRIAPVEAELLDPQQRMLLETSWEALEHAGLDPVRLRGSRTGVYGGVCGHDYEALVATLGDDPSLNLYRSTGVAASTAVGRVAFALGLEGPAITVDTACSSSLVAVHQAAAALRSGEADLALAGGVNAIPDVAGDAHLHRRRHAGGGRALQDLRRGGGRVRSRRGVRDGGAEAPVGRGGRRRPHPGGAARFGDQPGRRERGAYGSERHGAGAGDRGRARAGGRRAVVGGLPRGARHGHGAGGPGGGGGGGGGIRPGPGPGSSAAARLGEDECGAPRGRRRVWPG